jgi:hypothetical protein
LDLKQVKQAHAPRVKWVPLLLGLLAERRQAQCLFCDCVASNVLHVGLLWRSHRERFV